MAADNTFTPPSPFAGNGVGQQSNPWFTVANQFIPRNLHDVIRWSKYITIQSPTTSEVIRKYATYPITDFVFDTKSQADIDNCSSIVKSLKLKEILQNIGFEYFTIANVFISIHFPHIRICKCPTCGIEYNVKQTPTFKYVKFEYTGSCPACGYKGKFNYQDTADKSIEGINIILWTPENIAVNHNPITGESDYYYKIPNNVKDKVRSGDRLFVDGTPREFLEAIRKNQDFKFDKNSIFHLKNVSTGSSVNGIAIPTLISLFSLVFYQATLRKANEAIATEYLTPMRVLFPQASSSVDPLTGVSLRNFVTNMESALKKHKVDKNYALVAPTPVGYQPIGGEGRNLLVAQEIMQAEETILMALGVSRELLSGTTNWTSSTVGLRMLENQLAGYVTRITDLIEWIMKKVTGYLRKNYVTTTLEPFKLLDDDNLKSMLGNLVSTGLVSETTLLKEFGLNHKEEQDAMLEEKISKARAEIRAQFEIEKAQYLEGLIAGGLFRKEEDMQDRLAKAHEIAEQLYSADEGTSRRTLNELKLADYATYLMVAKLLDEAKKQTEHKEMIDAKADQVIAGNEGAEGQSADAPAQEQGVAQ